jgi:AbrB family looped-hinge helix DNA binding protein
METATITSKGQVTIPQEIREKLDLKTGDKVLFIEENGKYYFQNSNALTLEDFQTAMRGAAKEAGFNDPEDVAKYIKNKRGYFGNRR